MKPGPGAALNTDARSTDNAAGSAGRGRGVLARQV
jgi:hypothetical protein